MIITEPVRFPFTVALLLLYIFLLARHKAVPAALDQS